MRLATSTLIAAVLHAVLFGVAAAVLARLPAARSAPVTVEVEVITPKPDPVAESKSPTATAVSERAAPHASFRRHVAPPRTVAFVDEAVPEPSEIDVPAKPLVADPAPPMSASEAATAGQFRANRIPGTGATISATPRYRSNPKPDYPIPSKRRHEEGIVLLMVVVEPSGLPSAISLNRSCGHPMLDRAALEGVHRWTFEPARAGGIPIRDQVIVPVHFSLSEEP